MQRANKEKSLVWTLPNLLQPYRKQEHAEQRGRNRADRFFWAPELVQGRSQDFSRGGGVTEATHQIVKAHINLRQEPLTKILYKKTNFKKSGLFNNGFYGQDIVMAFFATWIL